MRRSGLLIGLICAALAVAGCAGRRSAREDGLPGGGAAGQTAVSAESQRGDRPLTTETWVGAEGAPPAGSENTPPAPKHSPAIYPQGATLETRFPAPEGYTRLPQAEDSFGSFVRSYALLADGEPVHLYDGRLKGNQEAAAAVFALPVLAGGDVQQCADSVMRMYAEYLWHTGRQEQIGFHFVSGFWFDYPTYRAGGRPKIDGNSVSWRQTASYDDSYGTFEDYLYTAFAYSSTLSMWEETEPADIGSARIGDVFLRAGSPGHVVMVADVCENDQGQRALLLAQGYMPAQQFHVLNNPLRENDPWYYEKEITYPFVTPEYTFAEGSFRRPTYQQSVP